MSGRCGGALPTNGHMSMVMISAHGFWRGWLGCCSFISPFFGGCGGNFASARIFLPIRKLPLAPEAEDYAEFLTAVTLEGCMSAVVGLSMPSCKTELYRR